MTTADDATAYADAAKSLLGAAKRSSDDDRSMPSQERLILAEGEEHYDEEMVSTEEEETDLTEEEAVITITEAKSGEDDDDEVEVEAVAKLLGSSLHKFEPKTQTFGLFSRSKLGTFDEVVNVAGVGIEKM